jgi:ferredoxin-NADP reductase
MMRDTVLVTLVHPNRGELPAWSAGSLPELHLSSGRVRHYCLCGLPDRHDSYDVAVLRVSDGDGGSIEIHDSAPVGRSLAGRGPRCRFPLVDATYRLMLSGGIGVPRLMAMARELAAITNPRPPPQSAVPVLSRKDGR